MSLEDIAHAIGQFVGGVAEEGTETVARKWLMPQNTTVCTGNTTFFSYFSIIQKHSKLHFGAGEINMDYEIGEINKTQLSTS